MSDHKYTLPAGTVLHSPVRNYTVLSVLGQGGFGITYKVSSQIEVGNIKVRTVFAVKEFFMKEARRLNEVFEANGTAYFVMEYLDGGDLRQLVQDGKGIAEAKALGLILPIARAMQYIHGKKLLHLDIKPDNIVMRHTPEHGDEPVLMDFGVSVHFDTRGHLTTLHNSVGVSEGYSPIEQYAMIMKFTPYSDVYALAATLLFLLTGSNPASAYEMNDDYFECTQTMAQFIDELIAEPGQPAQAVTEACVDLGLSVKWAHVKRNDVKGWKVTGPNGKYIFLPATGLRKNNATESPECGFFLTSSIVIGGHGTPDRGYYFYFVNDSHYLGSVGYCNMGFPVRAVRP